MTAAESYRLNARDCLRMLGGIPAGLHGAMIEVASAWIELAEETERLGDFHLIYPPRRWH